MTQSTDRKPQSQSNERTFFTGMTLLLFAAVFLGFSRSFFLRVWFPEMANRTPPESIFYWHGSFFAAWYLLLIVQAVLVARHSIILHRRLGTMSVVLAVLMVAIGAYAGVVAAARPGGFIGVPIPPAVFLVVPLGAISFFAVFYTLAISARQRVQSHKRYILLASIVMAEAAVARWPFDFVHGPSPVPGYLPYELVTASFLLPIIAWDIFSSRKLHPVTLWGGLALVAFFPLRMMLGGTGAWQSFAAWAIGLVS